MADSTRDAAIASLYPALTMQQIGDRFGVSRERIRQILARQGIVGASSGGRRLTPVADRFWPKVAKGDGCWEWQGSRYPLGYGHFSVVGRNGKRAPGYAHRVSWELHNGPIPAGMFVCHHCDNPPCVRPDHLFLGTAQDNVDDSIRKGRRRVAAPKPLVTRTPRIPRPKTLSRREAEAELIRQLLEEWGETA